MGSPDSQGSPNPDFTLLLTEADAEKAFSSRPESSGSEKRVSFVAYGAESLWYSEEVVACDASDEICQMKLMKEVMEW
jgi:hypothetical protein